MHFGRMVTAEWPLVLGCQGCQDVGICRGFGSVSAVPGCKKPSAWGPLPGAPGWCGWNRDSGAACHWSPAGPQEPGPSCTAPLPGAGLPRAVAAGHVWRLQFPFKSIKTRKKIQSLGGTGLIAGSGTACGWWFQPRGVEQHLTQRVGAAWPGGCTVPGAPRRHSPLRWPWKALLGGMSGCPLSLSLLTLFPHKPKARKLFRLPHPCKKNCCGLSHCKKAWT